MMSPNKMVVCERCGFLALLSETAGWAMYTTNRGLCPACVKEAAQNALASKPVARVISREH